MPRGGFLVAGCSLPVASLPSVSPPVLPVMEAFGVAANIISIIHITTEVVKRLNDFRATTEGLPRALKSLSVELPTLINSLRRIRQAIDDGRVSEESQEALEPLIKDFELQIQALSDIILKMRPRVNSNASRNLKAVTSFRYDSEVKHIEGVIRGYVSTLTLESAIAADNRGGAGMFASPMTECGLHQSNNQQLAVSQPLPTPRFICPFGKDVDFIERSVLADLLVLRGPGSRHAIVGAGGIGYVHNHPAELSTAFAFPVTQHGNLQQLNLRKESHRLQLSTVTESNETFQTHGFSGSMRRILRRWKRAIVRLPEFCASMAQATRTRMSLVSSTIGCATKRMQHG